MINNKGQSLLEVILAIALFGFICSALVSMSLGGFSSLRQGGEYVEAEALATQGIEAVRAIQSSAWNKIIYANSAVTSTGNAWQFVGENTSSTFGKYTRTISFANVCRDVSDNITVCSGSNTDVYSKQVTVTVSWLSEHNAVNTIQKVTYLTDWDSRDLSQSNWIGGSGQLVSSDTTKYYSDDGRIDTSLDGQTTIAWASEGTWAQSTGAEISDTSDTDFNAGAFSNTIVSGSGIPANVVLTQSADWSLHTDTGMQTWNDITCPASNNCWAVGNSGELVFYNGTTWAVQGIPLSAAANALYTVSTTNVWAVGASGRLWNYNGTSLSLHTDTGNETWNDITCTSASNCWAVGSGGDLANYDGTSWTKSTISPSAAINAVYAVSSTNIWAVGASGNIWRYNGTSWSGFTDTGNETWNDITCTSANNCWAVGNSGALARYNGTSWSVSTAPSPAHINGISAISSTNIWAVGAAGSVWNYNGSTWSLHANTGNDTWQSVYMVSASLGFMVDTAGQIFKYSNSYKSSGTFQSRVLDSGYSTTTWDVVAWTETIPVGGDITVAVRSGNTATPDGTWSAWSAEQVDPLGSAIAYTGRYLQYRLTLTRPTDVTATVELLNITFSINTPTNKHLNGIDMVSASGGWIVGNSGVILKYDGANWSVVASPVGSDLFDVTMISANDGWAVGASGKILRYNGTSWIEYTDTGNENWNAVIMVSANDGWAVGSGGEIALWNGSVWDDTILSPTGSSINDLYAISTTSIWAVGADNAREISYYNGTSWATHTNLSGNEAVQSVFFTSASKGWAVGDSGQIMKYNGSIWSDFQDTGVDAWRDGKCISDNDCWMVGDNGLIGRWSGAATWNPNVLSPTARQLNAIDLLSSSNGWAVGNNGTIIHFSHGAGYLTSGSFISSAFNMGKVSPIQVVEWDEVVPTGTAIKLQLRAAPDSAGSPGTWTNWYGATGVGTHFTNHNGEIVPTALNGYQWVQYRVNLSSDGVSTPVLEEVRVNYK